MRSLINAKCVVGLLGGSFNPAHVGHLYISLSALKMLGIQQVWWLVSPANPLKQASELADYSLRLKKARDTAIHPRIVVTDIEQHLNVRYTIDTVKKLKKRFFRCQFIWIMGADNLVNFHRWKKWRELADIIPIAVFDRGDLALKASKSPAGRILEGFSQPGAHQLRLAKIRPPKISYLKIRKHPVSASYLRKTLGKNAFMS